MGIFGRLFTPGGIPAQDNGAAAPSEEAVKPTDPKVPVPAPSGVRPQSASQTSSGEVNVGAVGKPRLPSPSKPNIVSPPASKPNPLAAPPSRPAVTLPQGRVPPPAMSSGKLPTSPALKAQQAPAPKPRKSSRPPNNLDASKPARSKRSSKPPPGLVEERVVPPSGLLDLDDQNSIASTFESLLGDLDEHFAGIVESDNQVSRPGQDHTASDLADVRALFAELAAHHMRSVRDFMIDVKWGEATRDWLPVCEPAVRSLMRASERLEIADLTASLSSYADTLARANRPEALDGKTLTTETRDELLASYDKMIELMPQAFALEMDRSQREAVIVQSLLLQIPDVRKVTIDKLYAANLTSLDVMFMAKVDEVMQTTGIEQWLAQRIVDRFQAYRHEMKAAGIDATRSAEHDKLTMLAQELKNQHDAFENASNEWMGDAAARRKQLRQGRNATLLHVKVILARLGEVDRLHAIERLPFEQKIVELESYLEKARDKYVPL